VLRSQKAERGFFVPVSSTQPYKIQSSISAGPAPRHRKERFFVVCAQCFSGLEDFFGPLAGIYAQKSAAKFWQLCIQMQQ
jgi:hypothetical protein